MKKAVEEKKPVAKATEAKKSAKAAEVKPAAKAAEVKKPAKTAEVKPAAKTTEAKKPAKAAEVKPTAKAAEAKKPAKAAEVKPAAKAAEVKKPAKAAEVKPAAKAAEVKKPAKAAEVKPAAKAAEVKKPAKAAEAKPAAKAAEAKKPVAKAEAKKAAKAVEKKEEIVITEDNLAEEEVSVTRPGIVEIYKGKEDFYFTFRSFHGFLIGRSQGYSTKDSCKNGVQAVMNACAEAEIFDNCGKDPIKDYAPKFGKAMFELYKDKAGLFRFRLFAKNSQRVAASEDYKSKSNLKSAIGSLKKIAANYKLVDSTLKKKADAK